MNYAVIEHGRVIARFAASELTYDPIFVRRITIWHKQED